MINSRARYNTAPFLKIFITDLHKKNSSGGSQYLDVRLLEYGDIIFADVNNN